MYDFYFFEDQDTPQIGERSGSTDLPSWFGSADYTRHINCISLVSVMGKVNEISNWILSCNTHASTGICISVRKLIERIVVWTKVVTFPSQI
jgi:hypothetical protein